MVAAQRKRSRVLKMAVWLPIAAAFVATTAWAGATGRFAAAVHLFSHVVMGEAPVPSSGRPLQHADVRGAAPLTRVPLTRAHLDRTGRPRSPAPPSSRLQRPWSSPLVRWQPLHRTPPRYTLRAGRPYARCAGCAAEPSSELGEGSKHGLPTRPPPLLSRLPQIPAQLEYLQAHDLHFKQGDYAEALDAWDRYLADAPSGRFAPEASGTERSRSSSWAVVTKRLPRSSRSPTGPMGAIVARKLPG